MTFYEYQRQCKKVAVYPGQVSVAGLTYCALGLAGESGELCNKVKKVLRDHNGEISPEVRAGLTSELGDCLWYAAMIAEELGVHLEVVAMTNVAKLAGRKAAGTLQGNGDYR